MASVRETEEMLARTIKEFCDKVGGIYTRLPYGATCEVPDGRTISAIRNALQVSFPKETTPKFEHHFREGYCEVKTTTFGTMDKFPIHSIRCVEKEPEEEIDIHFFPETKRLSIVLSTYRKVEGAKELSSRAYVG